MEMSIDFPGGDRVDAHYGGHFIKTDQPPNDSAPTPYTLFLASIGTCAGIYILGFCRNRNLPTEGIRLVQRMGQDPATGLINFIELEIQVPPSFPEKYYDSLIRTADLCKVKKSLANPPVFKIKTNVVA